MKIISIPRDGNVKHARVFQIALQRYGKSPLPVGVGGMKNFGEAAIFSSGGDNLSRSDFDHSNLFQG